MFKTVAPDSLAGAYVDKDIGTSTPGTKIIAEDQNRNQDEIVNAVEASGQTLDATKADLSQLARALTIAGAVSMSGTDTGVADAYVVDLNNAGIEKPTAYSQLDGMLLLFEPVNPNTGIAATLNFEGLGAKSLTDSSGATLSANDISGSVIVRYNLADDRFEFFLNNAQASAATESSAGTTEYADSSEAPDETVFDRALTPGRHKIDAHNASGAAPMYAPRAWVKFNGSGGSIFASGNVTSITYNTAGDWTVNITTALEDADHCCQLSVESALAGIQNSENIGVKSGGQTASSVEIINVNTTDATSPRNPAIVFFSTIR